MILFAQPKSVVDAHAHLLEYGFKRQLETDNCNSSKGLLNVSCTKEYVAHIG